jgi:putative spermidine/putrescine transport system permease protein
VDIKKRFPLWSWIWLVVGLLYFFIPLISTLEFSLRMIKGRYTLEAYRQAFADPRFYQSFGYSLLWSVLTIIISLLLIVPTAYWVHLRLPRLRPYVEFVTLMPFVVRQSCSCSAWCACMAVIR